MLSWSVSPRISHNGKNKMYALGEKNIFPVARANCILTTKFSRSFFLFYFVIFFFYTNTRKIKYKLVYRSKHAEGIFCGNSNILSCLWLICEINTKNDQCFCVCIFFCSVLFFLSIDKKDNKIKKHIAHCNFSIYYLLFLFYFGLP